MADTSSTTHEAGASSAPESHTSVTDSTTRAGEPASTADNANETQEPAETTAPLLAHEVPSTVDSAQAKGTDARPAEHQGIEPALTTSEAGEKPNGDSGTKPPVRSSEEEEQNDSDQDENKEDLLDLASRAGSADDIRKCLQAGADILATNGGGETALHIAARSDHAENLKVLLEVYVRIGLDINIKDDDGWTPLYGAAPYDSNNLIRAILEVKGVDLREQIPSGETPLYRACYYGNIVGVELMLAKAKELGYNIIDITNNDGWTPLHTACAEGELETVRVLLDNHAKVDGKDKIGQTALHVASAADRGETVAFLLSKPEGHTLIDLTDANKQTALHLATERDNLDAVKVLVKEHALLDIADLDGHTPLHLCAREGYDDVVKGLLEAKPSASVNARTKMDETALQLAGRGQEDGHFKAIKLLSGALPPQSRKKALLNFCGLEEYDALTRLLLHLNWEGLEPEEENIKTRANMIWNAAHPDFHDILRQALIVKAKAALQADLSQPDMPLTSFNIEELGALQWAAYLGDYLIVWWLLCTFRRGKELEDDRAQAFNIASWCKKQLVKQDHEKNDERNVPGDSRTMRRMSKENPGLDPRKAKSLSVHLPAHSDDGFLAPLGQGQLGLQQFDTSASGYDDIIDLLRDNVDPPLLPGWSETDNLFPKPTVDEISKLRPLTEQFDANIVDFYRKKDSRLNFLRRTRSVWEVVYAEGPKVNSTKKSGPNATPASQDSPNYGPSKIMNYARSKIREIGSSPGSVKQTAYTENDLQFRWIHLPANNLEWMIDLTRRIYDEGKRTREDFLQISEFIRQSIQELPGTRPYMNPISIREFVQSEKTSAKRDKEAESQRDLEEAPGAARSGLQEKAPLVKEDPQILLGTDGSKSPDPRCSKLALYMPYLTFATFTTQENEKPEKMPEGNELEDMNLLTKNEQLSAAYHIEKVPNQVHRAGSKNDARQDWKKLHESRTLDQFYYRSLIETEDRDETQVVTRYIDKTGWRAPLDPGKQLDILRVDQLWLWVIDETTIISSSTHRLDQRDDPVLEGIFNNLREAKGKSKGQPPPSSVDEMSKFITTFCIDQIDKDRSTRTKEDLSARQIFANTVNDAAIREAKLFQRFDDKITKKLRKLETRRPVKNAKARSTQQKLSTPLGGQKQSEQEEDYESISKATKLLVEVKDIRDELNILSYLLNQQKVVWRQLLGLGLNDDGTVNMNGISPKEIERWKGPGLAMKEVEEMDKIAQRIQDSVNSILGLEQNEANISEAEETRRQGDTLMVFTIITIVFLPMSFLASLFALNVTTFPHEGDNLVYEPKFIFSIIFSITAVISIPTIIFAGKKFFWRHWDKVRKYCILHWQTIEDHFKRIIDVLSNGDGGSADGDDPGGSSHNFPDKKALEKITAVEAPKKAKTEQKSVSQPKADDQPTITVTAPDSDKSSLQKPPSGKEIAASSSRNVGEQQLKEGEIEDSHGTGEGIWKFFTHPFSNHSTHPNRYPDIEQALKK